MNKFHSILLIGSLALASNLTATIVAIPNYSFELDGASQYSVPSLWQEDQARGDETHFAFSGRMAAVNGLSPIDGTLMGRIAVNGDADPLTSFTATISTVLTDTFAADTLYTFTVYAARDGYVENNQQFVVGGLRANGVSVANFNVDILSLNSGTAEEDIFYATSVSLSTVDNPSIVGTPISVYVGMRHNDNYNKTISFDNVSLNATAVPEPSTYAAFLALCVLGFVAIRRRC
ncbi:MAG: PEP-CTERM sorting domain-containing protein [Verrucomicrobiota bacterium]|nr:PEP-CTERM sorting domain-containing protein [Verrucomicrobiota bacterium]